MRVWFLSFISLITICIHSSLLAKLSLEECQTIALESGGRKTIADLKALIAFDRIDEARSSGRLQLNAHADYMTAGDVKHVHKNKRNKHARVSLAIPLYDFGLTRESVKSQKKLFESALYSVDQIEQGILYAVNEAYFELLIYQKLEWIFRESLLSLEKQLQVTQDFLSQGLIHRNESLVIEVQIAQLQQDFMEARSQTELATARLNRLMGLDMTHPTEIEDLLPDGCPEDNLDEFIAAARLNHPGLLALQAQIKAARHGYKAEKSSLYPNIYAFSNYSTTSDYALPYRQGLDAGIAIDVSLYDGGNTYAKLKRIKTELCELEFRYQELEKDIELNIRSAFLTIKTALGKIPVALKGVRLAEENLALTKDLFEEGLVTNVDVVNDEESLSQARINYYKTLYTFHQSRANLIYSAGMMYKKGCL